jgi:hypothetical protein
MTLLLVDVKKKWRIFNHKSTLIIQRADIRIPLSILLALKVYKLEHKKLDEIGE